MADFDHLPVHPGSVPDGPESFIRGAMYVCPTCSGIGVVTAQTHDKTRALAESHAELLKQMKTVQRYFGCGTWEWDDGEIFDTAAIAKAITRAKRVGG